jgi:hypothetical protein
MKILNPNLKIGFTENLNNLLNVIDNCENPFVIENGTDSKLINITTGLAADINTAFFFVRSAHRMQPVFLY